MPTASETTTGKSCPTCGAKLPEQALSLCPYCASPLELGGRQDSGDGPSPNQARLAKLPDHKDYEGAMAWPPPEEAETRLAERKRARGIRTIVASAVAVLLAGLLWGGQGASFFTTPVSFVAYATALWGFWSVGGAARTVSEAREKPILKRPAIILDRRSETAAGVFHGRTVYYYTIEFGDGAVVELGQPGAGANEDPLVTGITGVVYSRGATLLAFKQIRV
jgi:hypothetical protein